MFALYPGKQIFEAENSGELLIAERKTLERRLLHGHNGKTIYLPALPKAWKSGRITGLRTRFGEIVDIEWRDGQMVKYELRDITV